MPLYICWDYSASCSMPFTENKQWLLLWLFIFLFYSHTFHKDIEVTLEFQHFFITHNTGWMGILFIQIWRSVHQLFVSVNFYPLIWLAIKDWFASFWHYLILEASNTNNVQLSFVTTNHSFTLPLLYLVDIWQFPYVTLYSSRWFKTSSINRLL